MEDISNHEPLQRGIGMIFFCYLVLDYVLFTLKPSACVPPDVEYGNWMSRFARSCQLNRVYIYATSLWIHFNISLHLHQSPKGSILSDLLAKNLYSFIFSSPGASMVN
jgi:hypothetical protein